MIWLSVILLGMKITVRKLTKKDTQALKKILGVTFQKEFTEYTEKTRAHIASSRYIKKAADYYFRLGAFVDGKLVGYLLAYKPFGGVLYIAWLAIIGKFQRQGIGSLLLKRTEILALRMGAHNIHLLSEKRDIPFYRKNGFEAIGLDRKGYFGVNDYHLKKLIQEPKEENFLRY